MTTENSNITIDFTGGDLRKPVKLILAPAKGKTPADSYELPLIPLSHYEIGMCFLEENTLHCSMLVTLLAKYGITSEMENDLPEDATEQLAFLDKMSSYRDESRKLTIRGINHVIDIRTFMKPLLGPRADEIIKMLETKESSATHAVLTGMMFGDVPTDKSVTVDTILDKAVKGKIKKKRG